MTHKTFAFNRVVASDSDDQRIDLTLSAPGLEVTLAMNDPEAMSLLHDLTQALAAIRKAKNGHHT